MYILFKYLIIDHAKLDEQIPSLKTYDTSKSVSNLQNTLHEINNYANTIKNRISRHLQFKFQLFSIAKHKMQNITSTPSPFSLSLYKALTPIHFLIRDARYVEYTRYNTRKHRMVRS